MLQQGQREADLLQRGGDQQKWAIHGEGGDGPRRGRVRCGAGEELQPGVRHPERRPRPRPCHPHPQQRHDFQYTLRQQHGIPQELALGQLRPDPPEIPRIRGGLNSLSSLI